MTERYPYAKIEQDSLSFCGSKTAHSNQTMEVSSEKRAMLESWRSVRCPAHPPCIGGYGIRKTLDAYNLACSCHDGNHLSASSVLRLPAQRGDLLAQTAERP